MFISLLVSVSLAQTNETIIIESQRDVVVARAALEDVLVESGYRAIRRPDVTRYIHPQLWRPRVRVSEDGLLAIRSRRAMPMSFVPGGTLLAGDAPVLSVSDAIKQPAVAPGVAGTAAGRRTQARMESDLFASLEVPLRQWQGAIRAHRRLLRDEALREAMHAIWSDSGRSFAARRAALLEMWLNTADNNDGQRVQEMLEVFIDDSVQASAHPLTADEIAGANARRPSARTLAPLPAE